MNLQTMTDLAQRVRTAPTTDARLQELTRDTPDALLARFGLSHRPSALGQVLGLVAAAVLGAAIGAGVALALAPSSGEELRTKLRDGLRRPARATKAKVPDAVDVETKVTDGHRVSTPYTPTPA